VDHLADVSREDVLKRVDKELLKRLTLELIRIPSPTGQEYEIGVYMSENFES
jgi:hypothetical protein